MALRFTKNLYRKELKLDEAYILYALPRFTKNLYRKELKPRYAELVIEGLEVHKEPLPQGIETSQLPPLVDGEQGFTKNLYRKELKHQLPLRQTGAVRRFTKNLYRKELKLKKLRDDVDGRRGFTKNLYRKELKRYLRLATLL